MTDDLFLRLAQRALAAPPATAAPAVPWEEDEPGAGVEVPQTAVETQVEPRSEVTGRASRRELLQPVIRPPEVDPAPRREVDGAVPSAAVAAEPVGTVEPAVPPAPPNVPAVLRPAATVQLPRDPAAPTPAAVPIRPAERIVTVTRAKEVAATPIVVARPRIDAPILPPVPPAVLRERGEQRAPAPPGPVVEVTIDRVEVRVDRPTSVRRSPPAPAPPALSLDEYLARPR